MSMLADNATNTNDTAEKIHSKADETGPPAHNELFCAVMNPITGNYIDLSQLSTTPNQPRKGEKARKERKDAGKTRWLVKGQELNTNFTLGICSSPVLEEDPLSNLTGGYYVDPVDKHLVSIGEFTTTPQLVGKRLTLKYEGGDKCPNGVDKRATLLNFVCDKEISTKAQISFIGSMNNCSYFFEVHSIHACPTSHKSNDVNVLGIFFGIFMVFFLVEWGRRWFYNKMRASMALSPQLVEEQPRPHWDSIESQSHWKTMLKRLFGRDQGSRHGAIKLHTSAQYGRSTESLVRDIEAQNQLMDNLEVTSVDT